MFEEVEEKFLKFQCENFLEGFVGKRQFSSDGFSREVVVFEDDEMLGFGMIWGRVLLNGKLFDEDGIGLRHIFLHELGHTRRPLLNTLTGISQMLLQPSMLVIGLVLATVTGLMTALGIEPGFSPFSSGNVFLVTLAAFTFSVFFSQLGEVQAQFFAIEKMGTKEFEEALEHHRSKKTERSFLDKISFKLRYPPGKKVLELYKKLKFSA